MWRFVSFAWYTCELSKRKPTPKKKKRIKQCQFNCYIKLKCNVISLLFGFLFEQKQLQVEMIHRALQRTTIINFFCCFAGIVIAIVVVAAVDTKIIVLAADVVLHCYYIYSLLPLHEIPRLRHTKRQREREMYYILSGWFRCDTFHRCITSLMNFNRNCSCSTCFLSATE